MSDCFGFLNLDKPAGLTSRDVVNRVQRLVRPIKVGHCGTLDPLATGVLVVCLGPATRLTRFVQDQPKTYIGKFRLGVTSATDDLEGALTEVPGPAVDASQLEAQLPRFTGNIQQVPPEYSAVKVRGKRAYELARRGAEVRLQPRSVTIWQLELVAFQYPEFELKMQCSSGTYVRSLGRDLGRAVGSAAVMTGLRRTAIGNFQVDNSLPVDALSPASIAAHLQAPQSGLLGIPRIHVAPSELAKLEFGTPLQLAAPASAQQVAVIDPDDRLWAVMQRRSEEEFSPKWNFWKHWRGQSPDGSAR